MSLRKESGLTLLTLVITVIVAAILAVVTIDLAVSSDTVGKAKSLDMRVDMTEIVETWYTRRATFEIQGISVENMNYDDIKNATIFIGESTYKEKLIDTTEISDTLNSKIIFHQNVQKAKKNILKNKIFYQKMRYKIIK